MLRSAVEAVERECEVADILDFCTGREESFDGPQTSSTSSPRWTLKLRPTSQIEKEVGGGDGSDVLYLFFHLGAMICALGLSWLPAVSGCFQWFGNFRQSGWRSV